MENVQQQANSSNHGIKPKDPVRRVPIADLSTEVLLRCLSCVEETADFHAVRSTCRAFNQSTWNLFTKNVEKTVFHLTPHGLVALNAFAREEDMAQSITSLKISTIFFRKEAFLAAKELINDVPEVNIKAMVCNTHPRGVHTCSWCEIKVNNARAVALATFEAACQEAHYKDAKGHTQQRLNAVLAQFPKLTEIVVVNGKNLESPPPLRNSQDNGARRLINHVSHVAHIAARHLPPRVPQSIHNLQDYNRTIMHIETAIDAVGANKRSKVTIRFE